MTNREKWEKRVSWSQGVFESLERFVDSKPEENITDFADSGELDDLFEGVSTTPPDPLPSRKHIEYMQEYAQKKTD